MAEPSDIRILYIEDDEPLCDLFKVVIEAHGHSVDVAYNGEDGLGLHATQPYDLIATDYQLPDMTGIDIARKLLIDDPDIPIIMVTGKGNEQIAAEALALGVYNYVIKDSEKVFLELLPNIIGAALKRLAERHDKIIADNLLKKAIEGISEGFAYYDENDRLAVVNSKMAEIYPLIADTFVLGTSFEEGLRLGIKKGQFGPSDDQDEEEWIQERLAKHHDPKGSYEVTLSDGRCIRVEEKKTPGGGIVGVRTDITDLKELEHKLRDSEEQLRGIMKTAVDGIITIDRRGLVQSFNAAAEVIFGYTAKEVIDENVKMLMPEPDAQQHDNYINNYVRGGEAQIIGIRREVVGQRKDGSTFPMDLSISELRLDYRTVFTGIIRDVTERK